MKSKFLRSAFSFLMVFAMVFSMFGVASAAKGYDPNVDYSAAIAQAVKEGAPKSTIDSLTSAREAKINDVYGGKEPPLSGSGGSVTFNDVFDSSSYSPSRPGSGYTGGGGGACRREASAAAYINIHNISIDPF